VPGPAVKRYPKALIVGRRTMIPPGGRLATATDEPCTPVGFVYRLTDDGKRASAAEPLLHTGHECAGLLRRRPAVSPIYDFTGGLARRPVEEPWNSKPVPELYGAFVGAEAEFVTPAWLYYMQKDSARHNFHLEPYARTPDRAELGGPRRRGEQGDIHLRPDDQSGRRRTHGLHPRASTADNTRSGISPGLQQH
jgi:hypothetical protein